MSTQFQITQQAQTVLDNARIKLHVTQEKGYGTRRKRNVRHVDDDDNKPEMVSIPPIMQIGDKGFPVLAVESVFVHSPGHYRAKLKMLGKPSHFLEACIHKSAEEQLYVHVPKGGSFINVAIEPIPHLAFA